MEKRKFKVGQYIYVDGDYKVSGGGGFAHIITTPTKKHPYTLKVVFDGKDDSVYVVLESDVYVIDKLLTEKNKDSIGTICLEHRATENGYKYFCPERQENYFRFELNY